MNAGGAGFGHWLAADRTRQHFVHSFCHHPKTSHSEPHGSAVGTFSEAFEGGTAAAIPAGPLSNACASGLEFGRLFRAESCARGLWVTTAGGILWFGRAGRCDTRGPLTVLARR